MNPPTKTKRQKAIDASRERFDARGEIATIDTEAIVLGTSPIPDDALDERVSLDNADGRVVQLNRIYRGVEAGWIAPIKAAVLLKVLAEARANEESKRKAALPADAAGEPAVAPVTGAAPKVVGPFGIFVGGVQGK